MTAAASSSPSAVIAIDTGGLGLSEGLLALVRPALDRLEVGGVLAVLSSNEGARRDLERWCRLEHHTHLGIERAGRAEGEEGGASRDRHLIARGPLSVPTGAREPAMRLPVRDGRVTAAEMLAAVPMPERADPSSGFAPRGARVEPGGPRYPFDLLERDRLAPPEVGQLYDQAAAAQWDGSRDLPWGDAARIDHAPEVERAVGQVMTFLAENELSALYVPARFLPRIHPAYVEVAMFLATQLADEARHIDVFLKRARIAGGAVGVSSATTSRSLLSLLEVDDFSEASFLLSVLGEGTFLDLLRFIEEHAPDALTREIAKRTRADESRHVHFGLVHVRHALAADPSLAGRLEAAVRRRAATMHGAGGVPAPIQDALTMLAAGSADPKAVARGHEAYRALLDTMDDARIKRLVRAGFEGVHAEALSAMHTPNFM